jgi:hypothetical protein
MQRVMQNNAAVFRTQETLEEGNLFFADITLVCHHFLLLCVLPLLIL